MIAKQGETALMISLLQHCQAFNYWAQVTECLNNHEALKTCYMLPPLPGGATASVPPTPRIEKKEMWRVWRRCQEWEGKKIKWMDRGGLPPPQSAAWGWKGWPWSEAKTVLGVQVFKVTRKRKTTALAILWCSSRTMEGLHDGNPEFKQDL